MCDNCYYRQEYMRDGGFCYMFEKQIADPCGQYQPKDQEPNDEHDKRD